MLPVPVILIAYKNNSGEDIPPNAIVQFEGPCEEAATGAVSILVNKPSGDGPYGIDTGSGAKTGLYGQLMVPLSHTAWVLYDGVSAPATPWVTRVGPESGQWYVTTNGSGYIYAGLHDADEGRILVIQEAAGGGAQIVRFTLETTDCDSYEGATGTVVEVMCGGTSGVSVGDTIALEDPLGYLAGNPQLITGAQGMATKMGDACSWEIISMGQLGYNC